MLGLEKRPFHCKRVGSFEGLTGQIEEIYLVGGLKTVETV